MNRGSAGGSAISGLARQGRGAVLSVALGLWLSCAPQQVPADMVLAGGNVVDGTGAAVRASVDIFVAGDRIQAIVDSGTRPVPAGAELVDIRGKWVLPGLIDSHVHYRPWMSELFLYHGVTSVFDLGNEPGILEQRELIRSGAVKGPRLFVTGPGLQGPPPQGSGTHPLRRTVRSRQGAEREAIRLLDEGVDGIKVRDWMPADWIRAVTTVAHARNTPVVAHLTAPFHEAVEANVDAILHPRGIDLSTLTDAETLDRIRRNLPRYAERTEPYPYHLLEPAFYASLISLMVARGVFFNPTFGSQFRGIYPEAATFDEHDSILLDRHLQDLGYLTLPLKTKLLPFFGQVRFAAAADPEGRRTLELGMDRVAEFMRQFARAGGRMVAGSDTSGSSLGIPGVRLHRELQLWVGRGVEPMAAIRAATAYPADLFRLGDLGTVEVGKKADLIVLKGNPLDDIRLLGAIDRVVVDGRVLAREISATPVLELLQ